MKLLVALALAILTLAVSSSVIGYLARGDGGGVLSTAAPSTSVAAPTAATAPAPVRTTAAAASSSWPNQSSTSTSSSSAAPAGITMAELDRHNTSTSCWLLISGKVYDVTSYLRNHPGGSRTITPWCGKESTNAFATEDGRGEHSPDAYAHLDGLLIGSIAR